MKIETKFNVGDEVYVCKNNSTYEKEMCKICEGIGVISINTETFCYPKCHGDKFTNTKRINRFIPEKRTIRKVIVSISNNNGNIKIHTRYETNTKHHGSIAEYKNIIFATKEEAEYCCKGLNGEIVKLPNAMIIKDFAEKIGVKSAEIIKWLFFRGKIKQLDSEIGFDDMKEFADGYGFICERETGEKNIGDYIIKNIIFHIDPIEFYGNMIDFPVMCMEEIPDCFKEEVDQALNQAISELIENNNILDTSNLVLELDIRAQVNVTNNGTEGEFVVIVLDSEYKYEHVSKRIMIKDNGCLFEFKKYYTKKLEVLFFGDVKAVGGIR